MVRADYDLIVAGAGPAGGMAALTAAKAGLRVALVEEHPQVGWPAHCSGKIQLHAFREFALPQHLIMNTLRAGAFYAPDGSVARLRRSEPDSYVVDRTLFDRWLADEAQRHGADLILGTRLLAVERRDGVMRVRGRRDGRTITLTAPLVVDAEGARPALPASLGLRLPRAHVLGLQYQMDRVDLEEEDCPEIYLGRAYAPGFFAWIMPIGGRRARAGLCVDPRQASHGPGYYLERLIREHPVASRRLRGAVVERKLAGPIPVLGARRPSVIDRMLIAGDAAGQVKATSGGGIYFSLIAGRLAALAAHRFLGGDGGALAWYEAQWRRRFGRELHATAFARVTINHMTDGELNALIASIGDDERFRRMVEQRGDTAYQSRLIAPALAATLRWSLVRPVSAVLVKAVRYGLQALWDGGARLSAGTNGHLE
ncbi:MAG: NAD(P)/FAD-dependent oxidoreductase [Armatimonadota bacterium]|nr:NAD(P)/FAD-dependent oxidoreductase [Armatimonadota bacterium]MDR7451689.1 NAD(P)/FAD-dependent oxidoreductase [Armatimonadota bacterium]MDR7465693.1 NAD(P)/FAD-dependent oxidoreductase [Armatimonadota bacterium]MDR7493602.1 NAD(P)/FAD-dependent oxidoreductase [Armatimonadota bacterium]MDR7499494.1 NAD(P)/FAD-dependent oxidoreductase [Armatimonadota bacterium]